MRWNVVIGGQLFSKSFLGYTSLQDGSSRRAKACCRDRADVLPFVIFVVLVKLLPPWPEAEATEASGD